MKFIISETERGFLFKKGKFERMLTPGTYHIFGSPTVRKAQLDQPVTAQFDPVLTALFQQDSQFQAETVTVEVPDSKIGVHYTDGRFISPLTPGKYIYWNVAVKHTFELYDCSVPVTEDMPALPLLSRLSHYKMLDVFDVRESEKGLLLYDGKFQRMLEPGRHFFWTGTGIKVQVQNVDIRKQELSLSGQEILTKDKVGVRLNFVCSYRITDVLRAFQEIEDVREQFYTAVQLAVREYVSGLTLDELLTQRDSIAAQILALLRPRAEALYIEVSDAGVKDVILPGDVRDILNTVLIAEKKAQANVITRREEVASTRSLLNTAKLMDENKTLYKLKELEYLEKICENVGNISVSGGDLLAQLREIVGTNH